VSPALILADEPQIRRDMAKRFALERAVEWLFENGADLLPPTARQLQRVSLLPGHSCTRNAASAKFVYGKALANHAVLIDTNTIRNHRKSLKAGTITFSYRHDYLPPRISHLAPNIPVANSRNYENCALPRCNKIICVTNRGRVPRGPAPAFLLSSSDAPRMSRLMKSVLDKGNFFKPSESCWAFVFIGRLLHG
jgi:hypothetical protein